MAVLQVGYISLGVTSFSLAPGVKEGRNWCCFPHCKLPRCLQVGGPSGCWAVRACRMQAAPLSGDAGMFLVLCVCPVPGCLRVLDLCVMAVSGPLSFLLFFSSLPLRQCHYLVLIRITLSPLPGHYHLLFVYLWGQGRQLLDSSVGIN